MQVFCTINNRWMDCYEFYRLYKKAHGYGPFWSGDPLDSIQWALYHTRRAIENTKKRWPEKATR